VWPPLTPGDARTVATRVAVVLQAAWDELAAEQARVLEGVREMWRVPYVLATLEEFKAAITEFEGRVDVEARAFVQRQLPHLYEAGAVAAVTAIGAGSGTPVFGWTLAHTDALQSLAADSYDDFLRRSQEARRMSDAFYRAARQAARVEVPRLAAGNRTAIQAAQRLAQRLQAQHGLSHVIYRNGARVPVRAWAEAATLAKSAVAYNAGTLNASRESGVRYVEVFDGFDCGWSSHQSMDKANGTIRHVDEAMENPIAHPRCARSFGPRPDVSTEAQALGALPTSRGDS